MPMLTQALAWYAVIAAGGACGSLLLLRSGLGVGAAWGVGRTFAWTAAGYAAWLCGWAGLARWWWVAIPALAAMALVGAGQRGRLASVRILEAEGVFLLTFAAIAVLRLPGLDVSATEKPMDLAILAALLRPGTLPPGDPWLAGQPLPYYHFGFVPWLLPARALALPPDVVFNLLVPTVAAVSAQLGWALARALGCQRRGALAAAFLVVFAGTPDGWLQLLGGVPAAAIDLWRSSRGIAGAITEFPLFTFHLGDLHPHVLAVPLLLLALVLARGVGRPAGKARVPWPAPALAYGAAAAANPWCAVPGGLAVLLAVVAGEDGVAVPWGSGRGAWLRAAGVGAAGWILFAPFWLTYSSPVSRLGWVTTATRPDELALFAGAVLAPAVAAALVIGGRLGGFDVGRRQFARALLLAATVAVAAVTGRPALAIALAPAVVLAVAMLRSGTRVERPAFALTVAALLLLAAMELVYVRDPYAGELYRMNTVFKTTHTAFLLLAVTAPALLAWLHRRRARLAVLLAAVVLGSGLPHLAALVQRVRPPAVRAWDGLAWMEPGEAAAARFMFAQPGEPVLVEAVGDAYSDAARIASASGVPVVLGWENHERVWRGGAVEAELRRRRAEVEAIYHASDPDEVRARARRLGATHVVVGAVERRVYPDGRFDVVRDAGPAAFAAHGCTIVRVGE